MKNTFMVYPNNIDGCLFLKDSRSGKQVFVTATKDEPLMINDNDKEYYREQLAAQAGKITISRVDSAIAKVVEKEAKKMTIDLDIDTQELGADDIDIELDEDELEDDEEDAEKIAKINALYEELKNTRSSKEKKSIKKKIDKLVG